MARLFWFASLVVFGCNSSPPPVGPDAGPECLRDQDCNDGFFCSGVERCIDGSCEPGNVACPPPLLCDEAAGRCESPGCEFPDADGDGREAIECGGDDCDDADATRFPGNVETCDAIDQDCDPYTFGDLDADGDGFVSATCCNEDTCGLDCDDAAPAIGPTGTESCDERDNDCDGNVDEGVLRAFYPDLDGDNFGDGEGEVVLACARPPKAADNTLDCDDSSAAINPTGVELCDGVDNNCNGTADDSLATQLSCTASFGTPPNTFFACIDSSCSVDTCIEGWADCNAEVSDGCETDTRSSLDHCGACGSFCGVGGACSAGECDWVVDVAAGYRHTCVARSTGVLTCWGENDYGQLGNISTADRTTPQIVTTVHGVLDVETHPFADTVDAECAFTCARTADPLVYCWGCDRFGNKGDGEGEERSLIPEPVPGVPPASGAELEPLSEVLAVGGMHACAAKAAGAEPAAVLCWGATDDGQLGDDVVCDEPGICPSTVFPDLPSPATGPAERAFAGDRHTCVLQGARAFCVGNNDFGQLGDGSTNGSNVPVRVRGGHAFTTLALGAGFSCGVRTDGAVYCWGDNSTGQLGDGTSFDSSVPVAVDLSDAVGVAAGEAHACAWTSGGDVWCWGRGARGALGDGATSDRRSPVRVSITGAVQVTCGGMHTCALRDDGDVWCWGANDRFQLGDDTDVDRASPVRVDAV